MMKKILQFILTGVVAQFSFAQAVGINTLNPQEALHISGTVSTGAANPDTGIKVVTPTLRIDGLNRTNNSTAQTNPLSTTSTNTVSPLYVDTSGVLTISSSNTIKVLENGTTNFLATPITAVYNNNSASNNPDYLQMPLYARTITLAKPAILLVSANLEWRYINTQNNGYRRMFGYNIRIGLNGAAVQTYSIVGMSFSTDNTSINTTNALGCYGKSNAVEIPLPAGTHTININGTIIGPYSTGTAATPTNGFSVEYGGTTCNNNRLFLATRPIL